MGTVVRVIPGSRGPSARSLRAAVLALAAGALVVLLPAVAPVPAAAAAVPTDAGPAWEQAWSWDGIAAAVPPGCAATAGGGIACAGRPLMYARVTLRARLPRLAGAVTRIALDRSGVTLPGGAGGTHTYTLTWSPEAVSLAVDGREVQRAVSYPGPCLLRLTVAPAHRVPRGAGLLVESLRVEVPGAPGRAVGAGAVAATAAGVSRGGPPPALPGPVGSELPGRLPDTISALQTTTFGVSWMLGGTCVALGVLLGVLRAALASRRRPLAGS